MFRNEWWSYKGGAILEELLDHQEKRLYPLKMPTFPKAERFTSTPKSRIPQLSTAATFSPPKLEPEMKRQSPPFTPLRKIFSPNSTAGHTPHPRAIPSSSELQVEFTIFSFPLICRNGLMNLKNWWKF
jgi:hypothetical protein